MKKVASLYDSEDWEESESDIGDEEFTYTTQLRKRFMYFKVQIFQPRNTIEISSF